MVSSEPPAGGFPPSARVQVDGKQFSLSGRRFPFHGVTYGTFRPRDADGARFPERHTIKRDFCSMTEAGFTVVRTYVAPPDDLLELAGEWGLKVLAGAFYPDWRYLVGASRREIRRVGAAARAEVSATARRLAGNDAVVALSLGNEVPADVIRWVGTKQVASVLAELVSTVKEIDPDLLVTYANYPTAEYLPVDDLDFLTFNVFLERQDDFRRYLTRLHNLAADRPLVLGEFGLDATGTSAGETRQATVLDWQLETAVERGVAGTCIFAWTDEWWVGDAAVEGWHFGLTREDRSPRPALEVAKAWNGRTVRDLEFGWPSMSVVVCAYNSASTIDECLAHACALDYPDLEVLVIDDGSTDDTAAIAARYGTARVVSVPHAGLSVARNAGWEQARGDLIVYLDSDAYPPPEWPWYLALAMDANHVGGVGGPNVPPVDDPRGAQQVAQAPGGPVHVLLSDDRAEHVPGCNMGFWRDVLAEVGGFNPIYTAAGDDVDLCWRVLDRGWEIGFHPAALVWHHRRPGVRPYLRQQRGYGKSEALVEARHPDRFNPAGSARWRGHIYNPAVPLRGPQRIYRGLYGAAPYQSVYRAGGYGIDLAHQVGVPLAALLILTSPLGLAAPVLFAPAAMSLIFLAVLACVDMARVALRDVRKGRLRFRAAVAALHLLQPLARTWGRWRARQPAREHVVAAASLPKVSCQLAGGAVLIAADRPRAELASALILELRRRGTRIIPASGWEDYDARLHLSALVAGDLVSSAYPEGSVQLRVKARVRAVVALVVVVAVGLVSMASLPVGAAVAVLVLADVGRGAWRARSLVRRTLGTAALGAG